MRESKKLTHEECCRLVEDSLERVAKTLAYIRLRLDSQRDAKRTRLSLFEENALKESDLLCNINYYGAYISGAKAMYRALNDGNYLDIPKTNGLPNRKEDKYFNKAHLDCYMESTRNIEWLLHGLPLGVDIMTTFERDMKGKVIGAKSKAYKKEIVKKEI